MLLADDGRIKIGDFGIAHLETKEQRRKVVSSERQAQGLAERGLAHGWPGRKDVQEVFGYHSSDQMIHLLWITLDFCGGFLTLNSEDLTDA